MTLLTYKIAAAVIIFAISLFTVIYPLKRKMTHDHLGERTQLLEAMASGIFLGAAFFHLLPEAIKQFAQSNRFSAYPFPELICVVGFLIPLCLERISLTFDTIKTNTAIAYVVFSVLAVHALTEGAAIGVNNTFSEMLLIAIAIATHKSSECFALCVTLIRQQLPLKRIIYLLILFAFITPLGIFIGNETLQFNQWGWLPASINAFAAGTFLYISTLHHSHFHEHKGEQQGIFEFFALLLGVSAMSLLAIWS